MKSLTELFNVSVTTITKATSKAQYHFSLNGLLFNYVPKGTFCNNFLKVDHTPNIDNL